MRAGSVCENARWWCGHDDGPPNFFLEIFVVLHRRTPPFLRQALRFTSQEAAVYLPS